MPRILTRDQAIGFLYRRIDYERVSASLSASDFKLDRMRNLLNRLGSPQERVPAVHIAGTKGKGSTAAMIASVLQQAGCRTGLFTSPHIERFEERIRIDGALIDEAALVRLVQRLIDTTREIDRAGDGLNPTFFELITALAWLWFEERQVELAVIEVGLGGRLDSTNLCRPEVCVLTTISRDHTHVLGSRLREIAAEKAGIIKPGIPVVSGVRIPEAREVIEQTAARNQAPLLQIDCDFTLSQAEGCPGQCLIQTAQGTTTIRLPVPGRHQEHNAAVAVAAVETLRLRGWNIPAPAVSAGLERLEWPVRIERVRERPLTILDAAHNWASVGALIDTVRDLPVRGRQVLIFATSRDKDVRGLLRRLLPEFDVIIVTRYVTNPRALPVEELAACVRELSATPVHVAADPVTAWRFASRLVDDDGLLCIAGSFFLAAELRSLATAQPGPREQR